MSVILEALKHVLEERIEAKHAETNSLVEEINRLDDKDLFESVRKQILREELYRKQGEFSGLIDAQNILRDRFCEFLNCKSLKG